MCAPYTSTLIEYFVHTPWGASSYYLEHLFDLIIISLFNLFFGLFDCSLHLLKFIHRVILFFLQSLILNIVWFPSYICLCICACVFTYFFWICTPFWRNSHYIGLLSFSPILAMDANGGEVSRV